MQWEHDDAVRVTTRRSRIVKVDDKGSQQRVDLKGLKQEEPQKVWRPQDFGFSSNPPKDSDGVMIQMGSRSDRTLYLDGGHEKYRPKNTPEGGAVLFNHTGDIIRVFDKNLDVVHARKINIKIGKGYAAGSSGNGQSQGQGQSNGPDDASKQGDDNISIVATKDSITITFKDTSVKLQSGSITLTAPKHVLKGEVHLGDDGGELIGLCGGGCATKVFAV
jgi:phage gp45-like